MHSIRPGRSHGMLPTKLQRHLKIEVRYQDLEGEEHEMVLTDFPARVFQHEYDHLQVRALLGN